jgi:hypothetical protein
MTDIYIYVHQNKSGCSDCLIFNESMIKMDSLANIFFG